MTPSIKQRVIGKKAQSQGLLYERILQLNARAQGIAWLRIPDGCIQKKRIIVRVKSPFDWILKWDDKIAFVDTKSTIQDRIRYSDLPEHQIRALKLLTTKHAKAGFLVFYSSYGCASFFDVRDLSPGTSMAYTEGKQLGTSKNPRLTEIFL